MSTIPMPACPAGSVQQQVMQQYSYLFQMAQQLNLALERLEQGTGASSGEKGTEQQYRKLRSLIAGVEERLKRAMEELAAQMETEYVAADGFDARAAALSARLEAEPEELGTYYGFAAALKDGLAAVTDALAQYREDAAACVRTGIVGYDGTTPVYGTAVGQGLICRDADGEPLVEQNGFRAVFTDEGLSLRQDAQEVARVAGGGLRIRGVAALDGADMGGWRAADEADGLVIRWIGG